MRKIIFIAPLALIVMFVGVGALAPGQTAEFMIGLERSRADLETKSVSINGDPWPYLQKGPEDGETILLLHGFGGDKDNWVRFARELPDVYRVIIPDLQGFGDTNRYWDRDYGAVEQAKRVRDFVHTLALEPVHIVGHSMGGNIAGVYAHEYPETVRSLGLVTNGGIQSPVQSQLAEDLANGEDNVLIPRTREEFDQLIEFASYEAPFIPWPVKGYAADKAIADAEYKEYLIDFLWGNEESRLESRLPEIDAPVWVLWGRHDRLLDVSTVDVIERLKPDADVVILEESGHLPILEQPNESAGHYTEFLAAQ